MTDHEAITKIYQSQKKKLQRIEAKLIKEPWNKTEHLADLNNQAGVIAGVNLVLKYFAGEAQGDFDDLLSMEAK